MKTIAVAVIATKVMILLEVFLLLLLALFPTVSFGVNTNTYNINQNNIFGRGTTTSNGKRCSTTTTTTSTKCSHASVCIPTIVSGFVVDTPKRDRSSRILARHLENHHQQRFQFQIHRQCCNMGGFKKQIALSPPRSLYSMIKPSSSSSLLLLLLGSPSSSLSSTLSLLSSKAMTTTTSMLQSTSIDDNNVIDGSTDDDSSVTVENSTVVTAATSVATTEGAGKAANGEVSMTSPPSNPELLSLTFSLIKSMLGTGVLALPGALAVMSNYKSSLLPANILLIVMSILSAYTFILYGRLVHTQSKLPEMPAIATSSTTSAASTTSTTSTPSSLGELWNSIFKTNDSIVVSFASFTFTFGVAVAYSLIIGDIVTGYVASSLLSSSSTVLPQLVQTFLRQFCILAVTGTTLFPLCNLKSLSKLAPVSIMGVIGSLIASAFMVWRCPFINSGSPYTITTTMGTSTGMFSTYNRMIGSPSPLVLVATACVALSPHFGVCDFYSALNVKKDPVPATSTGTSTAATASIMKNFVTVTIGAFVSVAIVNAITMIAGFLTFGSTSSGFVLNNYNPSDIYASISKLLVAFSSIGAFPIVMRACQSEYSTMIQCLRMNRKQQNQQDQQTQSSNNKEISQTKEPSSSSSSSAERSRKSTSNVLLALVTAIALTIKDAGFVISFIGAVMGSNIIYTFPSLLFLKQTSNKSETATATSNNNNNNNNTATTPRKQIMSSLLLLTLERNFCKILVAFGIFSSVIGGTTSVLNSFFPQVLM